MKATMQNLVNLTPEQSKAWKRFEKAAKDFRKAGGKFYTVLETVSGYNGTYIDYIENDIGHSTADVSLPSFTDTGLSGFADDYHGFIVKEGVEVVDDWTEVDNADS